MDHLDHQSVGALIALDQADTQGRLVDAFEQAGFPTPLEAASATQLRQVLATAKLDLIIMSSEIKGDYVAPLIAEIRRGQLGSHPFPIIVALVPNPDAALLRQIGSCGPDEIVALPCEPQVLLDRINPFLAGNRRPLVVNEGYAGPERRTGDRAEKG